MDVEARLRAFAAVARERSFSRAAERLYVSQPAVSKHVASLEAELGTKLVIRGRPAIRLTPAGEMLADYVLRAEALLANARRALASGEDAEIGVLTLAASGIPGTYLLPALLSRFHQRHAGVEIDFRVATSGGALELVRSHAVELAVVGGMTIPPELESEPLIEDEVVLVGPRDLGGRRLRLKDLESQTWITREEGSATRAAVDSARWQIGLRAVRELELPSWEAVKLAVANGAGITAISRFALGLEIEAGALVVLDVPRWRLSRTISVVRAAGVPLTPPAARFLEVLREHFRPRVHLPPPNSNLPAPATPLVGRNHEVREVAAALAESRLVTLAGPGGSGKTRVAVAAAAREVDRFRDGVFFIDLTPIREPSRVLATVARAIGWPDRSSLSERLSNRSILLVLDNFEQVLDAAPEIAGLVEKSFGLAALVTSRVSLGVRGERVVTIPPLRLDDAALLFVELASATRPGLERDRVIERICERLDGLPLAIELAAARCNVLSPEDVLARLEHGLGILSSGRRDVDARQRTLRATIQWSCDLLTADAGAMFARLSVFAGGWAVDAAERICRGTIDTLGELVEHNLVRRDDDRFTMLDTIQRHASEMLEARGEAEEVRRRHAEYFAALAEEAEPRLKGPDQAEWIARLRAEAENVRAAVAWANAAGERELQLRIAGASWQFWMGLSGREEWREWLEQGLADVEDQRLRLLALAPLSWFALNAGEHERAQVLAEERIRLGRSTGIDQHVAGGNSVLAELAARAGDFPRARELAAVAVELDRKVGDRAVLAAHLLNLAGLFVRGGEYESARPLLEESGELARQDDNKFLSSSVAYSLAELALRERNGAEALALARTSLRGSVELGDPAAVWITLELTAAAEVEAGRPETGASLLAAADELRASNGDERTPDLAELQERAIRRAEEALGDEGFSAAFDRGRSLNADDAVDLALAD
jgi:DNA-binding transcriptional LysR family regulator/predicted ATPase